MDEPKKWRSSPGQQKRSYSPYLRYSGVAFQMIIIILCGLFAGIKADKYFSFKFPLFTLAGTLLGLVLAFYLLFKDIK